jgi:hypothetical protein
LVWNREEGRLTVLDRFRISVSREKVLFVGRRKLFGIFSTDLSFVLGQQEEDLVSVETSSAHETQRGPSGKVESFRVSNFRASKLHVCEADVDDDMNPLDDAYEELRSKVNSLGTTLIRMMQEQSSRVSVRYPYDQEESIKRK